MDTEIDPGIWFGGIKSSKRSINLFLRVMRELEEELQNCSMTRMLEGSVGKMRKKLPIGIDGFEKIRTNDFYYVDKTLFIKELLQNWGEVNLFTRPRRFGKSLNMSMLKCFFEIGGDPKLFDGLKKVGS